MDGRAPKDLAVGEGAGPSRRQVGQPQAQRRLGPAGLRDQAVQRRQGVQGHEDGAQPGLLRRRGPARAVGCLLQRVHQVRYLRGVRRRQTRGLRQHFLQGQGHQVLRALRGGSDFVVDHQQGKLSDFVCYLFDVLSYLVGFFEGHFNRFLGKHHL